MDERRALALKAAREGDHRALVALLAGDAALAAATDSDGNQPLHLACIAGRKPRPSHTDCVRALLDAGADIHAEGHAEGPGAAAPIVLAAWASRYNTDTVRVLLERGGKARSESSNGLTALAAAVEHGEEEMVRLLMDAGAPPEVHDLAALGRTRDLQDLLWQQPTAVNRRDPYLRATPLYFAARHDRKDAARLLLDFGADIGAQDRQGNTALHVAAASGSRRTMELLLEHGADVNARNDLLQTPLHWAVEEWWFEGSDVVRMLTAAGANVNLHDSQRITPLGKALSANKTQLAAILRRAGARE